MYRSGVPRDTARRPTRSRTAMDGWSRAILSNLITRDILGDVDLARYSSVYCIRLHPPIYFALEDFCFLYQLQKNLACAKEKFLQVFVFIVPGCVQYHSPLCGLQLNSIHNFEVPFPFNCNRWCVNSLRYLSKAVISVCLLLRIGSLP